MRGLIFTAISCMLAGLCCAVSSSAQRVEGRFAFVPYPDTEPRPPDNPLSPACPASITFSRIETYQGINEEQPDTEYDGILWDDLLVDDSPCQGSPFATTSTYFELSDASPPATPPDSANPWFLTGSDNSPLRCPTYNPLYPARYFFTDDLPRFHDQLVRYDLLTAGRVERPIRGNIYLFVVFLSEDGQIMDPNVCLFDGDFSDNANSEVASSSEAASSPEDVVQNNGPACLSAKMPLRVPYHSYSRSSYNRFVSDFRAGDAVSYPSSFPQSYKRLQVVPHDTVISFSHRESTSLTRFVSISVCIPHNGSRHLELSPGHLMYLADHSLTRAANIVVGDRLLHVDNELGVLVVRVSEVVRRGIYAPITKSGRLLVHGVVISCYTDAVGNVAAHSLLAPVRATFSIYALEWCAVIDILRLILFSSPEYFKECVFCTNITTALRTVLQLGYLQ